MPVKLLLATLAEHPRLTSVLGAISGWFSYEMLAKAKEAAQLGAALLAGAVSLCALILTAPKAWSKLQAWWRAWREPKLPFGLD